MHETSNSHERNHAHGVHDHEDPSHEHGHAGHDHDLRGASRRSLRIAFFLIAGYMGAEIVGGLAANSLALLADAGHMLTDAASLGLALIAIWFAARPASIRRTFGFQRAEILAALLNALSLWLIAAWIFVEAYRRFLSPPEVQGPLMLGVGSVGLLVNIAAAWILMRAAGESLNVEGALLHVLGDLLGSIGVVVAGVLVLTLGWQLADPIFGVIIGVLILISSTRLLLKVLRVLMEETPARLDMARLCREVEAVPGVTGIHDIHAWTLTSGYDVLTAHVTTGLPHGQVRETLLQQVRDIAAKRFGITHVTIQLEDTADGCEEESHHAAHA